MKILTPICIAIAVAALAVVTVSCETAPANEAVRISPSAATIHEGESVKFTASAGYLYRWELVNGDPSLGYLTTLEGQQTTYKSIYNGASNGIEQVTLRVTSTLPKSATTNGVPDQWTAEAIITHL